MDSRLLRDGVGKVVSPIVSSDRPLKELLEDLAERREAALHAGSERSVERQHARNKMLARERIG